MRKLRLYLKWQQKFLFSSLIRGPMLVIDLRYIFNFLIFLKCIKQISLKRDFTKRSALWTYDETKLIIFSDVKFKWNRRVSGS